MDDDLEQARYTLSQAAAGTYVMRHEGRADVRIDGDLTLAELKALVWIMEHSQEQIAV